MFLNRWPPQHLVPVVLVINFMRYTYYFKDRSDVVINDPLRKNEYDQFIIEFKQLNSNYNFEVYLSGGYLAYITKSASTYNDIDFFVMAEKIVDLDDLTEFFKLFHELAKKYKFAYDLIYFMDATADDLNMNPNVYHILNIESTRTLKLYHKKVHNNYSNTQLTVSGSLVPNTELYQGTFNNKVPTTSFINKVGTKSVFQKPIKIS
jgi:hypothetical protein